MSVKNQLRQIEAMYTKNVQTMGTTSKTVGWNTDECQALRFSKLADVLGDAQTYSVNDYGCGYGAQLLFLQNKLGHKVTEYNGYDISYDMLEAAKIQLADYKGALELFQEENVRTQADYSFVSGTFNVRFDADTKNWERFIRDTLDNLNRNSTRGFAFNMLTSYADWEEPHLYYGDPCFWFDYCKKNFSKHVSILHDYPLWEWTMIVKKEGA